MCPKGIVLCTIVNLRQAADVDFEGAHFQIFAEVNIVIDVRNCYLLPVPSGKATCAWRHLQSCIQRGSKLTQDPMP